MHARTSRGKQTSRSTSPLAHAKREWTGCQTSLRTLRIAATECEVERHGGRSLIRAGSTSLLSYWKSAHTCAVAFWQIFACVCLMTRVTSCHFGRFDHWSVLWVDLRHSRRPSNIFIIKRPPFFSLFWTHPRHLVFRLVCFLTRFPRNIYFTCPMFYYKSPGLFSSLVLESAYRSLGSSNENRLCCGMTSQTFCFYGTLPLMIR